MKTVGVVVAVLSIVAFVVAAQNPHGGMGHSASHDMEKAHEGVAAVSLSEMKKTVTDLERAKQATAKYQDVRQAQADGYQALGAEFPGMGTHFVRTLEVNNFDVENPPILLYHQDPSVPGGYLLVGVGYLWNGPEGSDGQPLNPPFPKSLAHWHKHDNVCMLPGLDNPHALNEAQCREKGGQFVGQTAWLVHAWIWKDNPAGVFTAANPSL